MLRTYSTYASRGAFTALLSYDGPVPNISFEAAKSIVTVY
jgi:hypothetical protein